MTMPAETTKPVALLPYVLKFAALYALASIVVIVITTMLNFEIPSAMGIITLIATVAPIAQMFVTAEKRPMTNRERVRFATGDTVAVVLVTAALVTALSLAFGGLAALQELIATAKREATPLIVAIVAGVTIALTWPLTYFCVGFQGRQTFKQLTKAGKV